MPSKTPTARDDDGREYVVVSYYKHCGTTWQDTWDCDCNSDCPVCEHEIESYNCDIIYLKEEAIHG